MNIKVKDQKYLGREGSPVTLEITGAKGSYMYGPRGQKYIDFSVGWCVGNIGWGVPEAIKAIKKYSGPDYVAPNYLYKGWAELAELFAKITPGKLTKSFRATGGTESVEIALQAAMYHTKRSKFISVEGSYHGHSIGAMSVGDSAFRNWYSNLLPGCEKIKSPLDADAGRRVEALLSKGDIAAYISEPIICNLGVEIPTQEYWDIVQKACKKYGAVLIIDEVATGFGRTGKLFASEHYDLQPDIMCIAKGATGGFGALGAAIMTPEIAKSFEFVFNFYSTFGWHPLNVEATLGNLRFLVNNKKNLLENANNLGAHIQGRLCAMKFKNKPEIRQKGLAICLKFSDKQYAKKLEQKAQKRGLLIDNSIDHLLFIYPALTIDKKTVDAGLKILEQCI